MASTSPFTSPDPLPVIMDLPFAHGARKTVAIVSPVCNAKARIAAFIDEVARVVAPLPYTFSIVLVNDGSDEATTSVLDGQAKSRPHVDAKACICIDSDLQQPPSLIPQMLRLWEQGCPVVYTIRDDQQESGLFKGKTSALFYRLLKRFTERPLAPGTADFRLLDRSALAAISSLRERTRFLRGLTVWIGFRPVGVHYQPAARCADHAKYTLSKMFRLAVDGLLSTTLPLRAVIGLGLAVSAMVVFYLLYVVAAHFILDRAIVGSSSVIVSVLLPGGIQLCVPGMLGMYLAKVFDEVKGRPLYIVQEKAGRLRDKEQQ